MKIYIKNMVCARCKIIVRLELEKLEIHFKTIELNEIETTENISQEKLKQLGDNLRPMGLELTENRKDVLAEKIRTAIIELINSSDGQEKTNLSDYLSGKLNHRYIYLANVFSAVKGISIEKFFITHKIERVKELLVYHELSLKEISFITKYSSIAHLSYQFKKITGLAPSQFRHLKYNNPLPVEKVA
jgi:AraC-like DNA-binding protein